MEGPTDQLEELARQTSSLRAALARVRAELDAASALEQELSDKLRAMGAAVDDDAEPKTTVDTIEVAGLPGRRRPLAQPSSQTLKAAAVGAGLTIGLALVVLLIVDLALSRRTQAAIAPAATVAATATPPPTAAEGESRDAIPPPPPPEAVDSAGSPPVAAPPVTIASAPIPKSPEPIAAQPAVAPSPSVAKAEPSAPTAAPAASGAVTIVCTPKCDAISYDNVPISPSAAVNVPVPAGPHKLVLSSANGVKKTMHLNVAPGQKHELRVSMESTPHDRGF